MTNRKSKNKLLRYGSVALAAGAVAAGGAPIAQNAVHASSVQNTKTNQQTSKPNVNPNIKSSQEQAGDKLNEKQTLSTNKSAVQNPKVNQNAVHGNHVSQDISSYPSVQNYAGPKTDLTPHLLAQTKPYTIQSGDNINTIAQTNSVSTSKLHKDNPGVDFNHLVVGQNVRVPSKGPQLNFNFVGHHLFLSPIQSAESQSKQKLSQVKAAQSQSKSAVQASQSAVQASKDAAQASQKSTSIPTAGQQNSDSSSNAQSVNNVVTNHHSNSVSLTSKVGAEQGRSNGADEHANKIQFIPSTAINGQQNHQPVEVQPGPHTMYQTDNTTGHNNIYSHDDSAGTQSGYRTGYQVRHVSEQSYNDGTNRTVTNQQPKETSYRGNNEGLSSAELEARNWISTRESGNNYNARNGDMIGKYQLTASLLHGNYSPANQDRTANQYAQSRYGGWVPAKGFWQAHHWY